MSLFKPGVFYLKGHCFFLAKVLVSLTLIFVAGHRLTFESILAVYRQADWFDLRIAGGIGGLALAIQILKWRLLLQRADAQAAYPDALRSFFAGMALGLMSPGRVGELGRALFISSPRKALIIEMTIIDKLSAVMAICFWGGLAFWLREQNRLAGLTLIGACSLSVVCWQWPMLRRRFQSGLSAVQKMGLLKISGHDFLLPFVENWPETCRRTLCLAVIMYGLLTLQFYFLLCSFHSITLAPVFSAFPVILLINLIPITFAGLGLRENMAVILLHDFTTEAAALNAAFLIFVLNILLPAIVGGIWIFMPARKVEKNRS